MDIRRAVGAKRGIPFEKLDALVRYSTSDRFTARAPLDQVAIATLRAVGHLRVGMRVEHLLRDTEHVRDVTDACVSRLREHFSEAEVVELTFIVGYQTFASKFAKAFRLPPQGFTAGA